MEKNRDSSDDLDLEGSLGLVTGLPFDDEALANDPIDIAVTCFAKFDPKAADRINSVRDDRLRTTKMNEFIKSSIADSDPVLQDFAYGDQLKGTGLRFFFGDESEAIEEFIDDNKSEMDRYLESIDRHAIGGFTFSSGDRTVKMSPNFQRLLVHLRDNYFNVDEI